MICYDDDDDDDDDDDEQRDTTPVLYTPFINSQDQSSDQNDLMGCHSSSTRMQSPSTLVNEMSASASFCDQVPDLENLSPDLADFEPELWTGLAFEVQNKTQSKSNCESEREAQDETEAPAYNADPFNFNWSSDSILGGSTGIWHLVRAFPDPTRISKHISAVQNVLSESFTQLVTR